MIRSFKGTTPRIHPTAYVDESAQVLGDVEIGEDSSVWCNTVIRGDVHSVRIGAQTNVQDLCCLHVFKDRFPLTLGRRVTIGHHVMLHGCTIEDRCLIGMGAILLDGCVIGTGSLIAAGALLTPGTVVPPNSLVLGSPAKVKRAVSDAERALIEGSADNYVENARLYLSEPR
jgi:carbonic anhydrase/acetyltransferase-like protein (isoleucine patch superfamily)